MPDKYDKYYQSTYLVVKTAYLYYIMDYPQTRIAEELGISVTTVSRLLKKAREDHIIEFVIRDSYINCITLEQQLKDRFGLKDAVIAPGALDMPANGTAADAQLAENVKKAVALETARYLQRIIREDDVLGVTWGSHVYHMINYLNPGQKVGAKFVTLHGSIACCDNEMDVRTLVSRMARAFSGQNYYLLAESLASSKEIADILKQEKNNAAIFQMFDQVTISVNGIGSFYPELKSILASPDFMPPEDLQRLLDADVCGDISLRFFDRDGKECATDLSDRMLAIGYEQFKRIPRKITIASGHEKKYPILSAMKAGLIDVLIIDNSLAEELLEGPGSDVQPPQIRN